MTDPCPSPVGIVLALGEAAEFDIGNSVRVMTRFLIGHYRVPRYVRGKKGEVAAVIHPLAVDNEEEAFGRNAARRAPTIALSSR